MNTSQISLNTAEGRRRLSQNDIILRELQESSPSWVDLPRLIQISGSAAVHSRITNLRERGYTIDQQRARIRDGIYHSQYRLIFSSTGD